MPFTARAWPKALRFQVFGNLAIHVAMLPPFHDDLDSSLLRGAEHKLAVTLIVSTRMAHAH